MASGDILDTNTPVSGSWRCHLATLSWRRHAEAFSVAPAITGTIRDAVPACASLYLKCSCPVLFLLTSLSPVGNTDVSRIGSNSPSLYFLWTIPWQKFPWWLISFCCFPLCFCHVLSFSRETAYVLLDSFPVHLAISREHFLLCLVINRVSGTRNIPKSTFDSYYCKLSALINLHCYYLLCLTFRFTSVLDDYEWFI